MTEAMPKPKSIDAPEWVNYTPDETTYSLVLWDENGEGEQEIAMRRTEFLTLKRWLAALRGYEIWKMSPHSQEWRATHLDEENGDDITRDDLRMLVDVDRVEMVLALNLRRRLERGAKVEEGKLRLDFKPEISTPIEEYEKSTAADFSRCDIDIASAEEHTLHAR